MTYSQLISSYLSTGTHAARPVTPNVAAGTAVVYFETDTNNSYLWNGSAWVQLNVAGSGGITQLSQQQVTGSNAANVTFSGISGSYSNLLLEYVGRCDDSGTGADNLLLQLNADSAAHYDVEDYQIQGTSPTAAELLAQTSALAGSLVANGNSAGYYAHGTITFPAYAATFNNKSWTYDVAAPVGTATTNIKRKVGMGVWRSTSAITSIKLFSLTGNILVNSTFTLYGLS